MKSVVILWIKWKRDKIMNKWYIIKETLTPIIVGLFIGFVIGRLYDNTSRIKALEDNFKSYQAKMISK